MDELKDYTILQYTGRDIGSLYFEQISNEPMKQGDIVFVTNTSEFVKDAKEGMVRYFLSYPEDFPTLTAYKIIPYKV